MKPVTARREYLTPQWNTGPDVLTFTIWGQTAVLYIWNKAWAFWSKGTQCYRRFSGLLIGGDIPIRPQLPGEAVLLSCFAISGHVMDVIMVYWNNKDTVKLRLPQAASKW